MVLGESAQETQVDFVFGILRESFKGKNDLMLQCIILICWFENLPLFKFSSLIL